MYGEQFACQAYGPLRQILVPEDHSRLSRHRLLMSAMATAIPVDPDEVFAPGTDIAAIDFLIDAEGPVCSDSDDDKPLLLALRSGGGMTT